jgi:hypothetical protein
MHYAVERKNEQLGDSKMSNVSLYSDVQQRRSLLLCVSAIMFLDDDVVLFLFF